MAASVAADGSSTGLWHGWRPAVAVAYTRRGRLTPQRVLAGAGRPPRRWVAAGPRSGWARARSGAREAGARACAWEGRRVVSSDGCGCGCGWRGRHNVALAGVTATGYVDSDRGWVPPPLAWRGWSGTSSRLQQCRLVARTSAGWWRWQAPKYSSLCGTTGQRRRRRQLAVSRGFGQTLCWGLLDESLGDGDVHGHRFSC
jgi:hypothetical protein|uniref:Uncharacterized protein n=1 Tax=Zea mays TaxID=4577 RepID=A0A804UK13_MAIZE